jgi:TRAP-type mannitol/chloroaromatic compound transport system permease small subunit
MSTSPPSQFDHDSAVDDLIHRTDFPHTKVSVILDAIVERAGNAASWIWVALMGVIVMNVTLRYVFGEGRIEFEELQWHLYAAGFLIGLSYCFQRDGHIRIDILHDRFSLKKKAWVDFIGILIFLIPYVSIVLIYSPSFIEYSFSINEISDSPGGLPYRWVIKSFMFTGYLLLLFAALARLSRVAAYLFFGAPAIPKQQ